MEAALHERDKVGVQDFVLLTDFTSIDAFVDNLEKRFRNDLIYTYIGPVLVSVNPYKHLDIYTEEIMGTYRNLDFYELPPHIFALSDAAYRYMYEQNRDQCILISGESGAGKTEASKKVLQYIAATSHHSKEVEKVKDRLLESNPILEAFGNAKTTRNDNSSRFGKYMDIQFDFNGVPVGGHILNYLLEKSRVVKQASGERCFHIFYQLLAGADDQLLTKLCLRQPDGKRPKADAFAYLGQGLVGPSDAADFQAVKHAFATCGFSATEQTDLLAVVAAVLHLGNIKFSEADHASRVVDDTHLFTIAKILGTTKEQLANALLYRTVAVKGDQVKTPLAIDQAFYARDALAKAVYDRMFSWLVQRINSSLTSERKERRTLLGLLDIYGFEIFERNSFEQFCINYCNEKLQQLFIELTLKQEQDEYQREGIEWVPVEYFNNKVICDLIDSKPLGIIAIMDEECLMPGEPTDITLLEKMSTHIGTHVHFLSHLTAADTATRKTIARNEFRLLHYAGEVTYQIDGFLDKNNDLLFRDLKEVMRTTTNCVTSAMFTASELQGLKRPETAGTSFKASLAQLMDILMSKEPSYVRCIKPNANKQASIFSRTEVNHQVKYLGLMENLRVRRAGFAYRRQHETFLQRYKSLCPETWPTYRGPASEGVRKLVTHLNYLVDDYRIGRTKIFIRLPKVLFATEDLLQQRRHELAARIQAVYRGYSQQKKYNLLRLAAIVMAKHWRRVLAQRLLVKRRNAAQQLRRFIKGFMLRYEPECPENANFIHITRRNYLNRLATSLPKNVLDKSWPSAPRLVLEAHGMLRQLNMRNMVRRYCRGISATRKEQMSMKVVAERLFKGKKSTYAARVHELFVELRELDAMQITTLQQLQRAAFDKPSAKFPTPAKITYACKVVKYDRNGYKPRERILLVADNGLYTVDAATKKVKDFVSFLHLTGISVTSFGDNMLVLHVEVNDTKQKGDILLCCGNIYEAITHITLQTKKDELVHVISSGSIKHLRAGGKDGFIDFSRGDEDRVAKSKDGRLCVVSRC